MTDYRALCARMADELDHYRQLLMDDRREAHALATEARAALAHPEPVGPTDEELREMWLSQEWFNEGATFREFASIVRRWGRPAIKPVPVAERLPGSEDCDAEGECWWWHPDHKEDEFSDGWMLLKPKWADGHHDADDSPVHTHWLPHHALPVPQQEVQ